MGSSSSTQTKSTAKGRAPPRKPSVAKNGRAAGNRTTTSNRKPNRGAVDEPVNKRRIRDDLTNATDGDDIQILQNCMDAFKSNDLQDKGEYNKAVQRLEFLKLRKEITDACVRRNSAVLAETIRKVQASKFRQQMRPQVDRATYIVSQLGDTSQYKHSIPGIDNKTISEIRRLHHPPQGVHETMISTYLILGYPEKPLRDWTFITALMGRHGNESLQTEMSIAEKRPVPREVAPAAKHYLSMHSLDDVRQNSNGAAAFYVWASQKVGMPKSQPVQKGKSR